MNTYQDKYKGIIIEDHDTTTCELFERLADGGGLICRIITEWDSTRKIPSKILDNRIRLVFYDINFDSKKTEFMVFGYIFGDFPVGLKPGKYQFKFNRFLICHELSDEMFETDNEVVVSTSELFGSNTI